MRYEVKSEDIAAEVAGGEAVVLNLSSGVYYSLAGTGAAAWMLLAGARTPAEAGAVIAERYRVDAGTAIGDAEALLVELLDEGLLVPSASDSPADVDFELMPEPAVYSAPQIERYSDMEQLLALDPPMPGLSEVPWQAPPA